MSQHVVYGFVINMNNTGKLLRKIIKFVDNQAVTTVDAICKKFERSIATFYRIKCRRLIASTWVSKKYTFHDRDYIVSPFL